jgi:hypothetical protein
MRSRKQIADSPFWGDRFAAQIRQLRIVVQELMLLGKDLQGLAMLLMVVTSPKLIEYLHSILS